MSNAGDRLLAALSMPRYVKVEHINLEAAQDIGDGHLRLLTTKPMDSVVSINLNGCENIQYGLYYVATTCPKLKHFSISNNLKVKNNYFAQLLQNCKFLTDLNLSGCKNITDEGVCFVGYWCRTLESLNIDRCDLVTDTGVLYIAEVCENLKYLSFFGIDGISDKCFQTLSKFCPKTLTNPDVLNSSEMKEDAPVVTLESILGIVHNNVKLQQRDLVALLLVSSRLRSMVESDKCFWQFLDLHGMNRAGDRLLAALRMPRYEKVEHINLEAAQDIDDHHLKLLSIQCLDSVASVVSFNLNDCPDIFHGVYYVARSCPKLKHFSISNNLWVTDKSLVSLLRTCKFLSHLNLSGCKNLTDGGLYQIGSRCHTLEFLNIDRCELVTENGVMCIAEMCPHLQYLSLFGICGITDKCLETLSKFLSHEIRLKEELHNKLTEDM